MSFSSLFVAATCLLIVLVFKSEEQVSVKQSKEGQLRFHEIKSFFCKITNVYCFTTFTLK